MCESDATLNGGLDKTELLKELDALLAERGIEHTVHDGFGKYDRCASVSVGNCHFTEFVLFDTTPEGLPTYESFLKMDVCDITPETATRLLDVVAG